MTLPKSWSEKIEAEADRLSDEDTSYEFDILSFKQGAEFMAKRAHKLYVALEFYKDEFYFKGLHKVATKALAEFDKSLELE